MTIHARKPSQTNVDGECHATEDLTIELVENGLTFVVPRDSKYFEQKASGELNNEIKVSLRNRAPFRQLTAGLNPFNLLVNRGLLRLIDPDRNYLK